MCALWRLHWCCLPPAVYAQPPQQQLAPAGHITGHSPAYPGQSPALVHASPHHNSGRSPHHRIGTSPHHTSAPGSSVRSGSHEEQAQAIAASLDTLLQGLTRTGYLNDPALKTTSFDPAFIKVLYACVVCICWQGVAQGSGTVDYRLQVIAQRVRSLHVARVGMEAVQLAGVVACMNSLCCVHACIEHQHHVHACQASRGWARFVQHSSCCRSRCAVVWWLLVKCQWYQGGAVAASQCAGRAAAACAVQ